MGYGCRGDSINTQILGIKIGAYAPFVVIQPLLHNIHNFIFLYLASVSLSLSG